MANLAVVPRFEEVFSTPAPVPIRDEIELSVVLPCLNEEGTLAACILKAQEGIKNARIVGEIIIADNGSTDASRQIALRISKDQLASARKVNPPSEDLVHRRLT